MSEDDELNIVNLGGMDHDLTLRRLGWVLWVKKASLNLFHRTTIFFCMCKIFQLAVSCELDGLESTDSIFLLTHSVTSWL